MGSVISCNFKARLGVSDAPRRGDAPPPPSSWAPFPPWVVPAGAPALLRVAPGAPSPTQPGPCPQAPAPKPPARPSTPGPHSPTAPCHWGRVGAAPAATPLGGGGRGARAAASPRQDPSAPCSPSLTALGRLGLVRCAASPPRRTWGKAQFMHGAWGRGHLTHGPWGQDRPQLRGVPAPGPTELLGPNGAARGAVGGLRHRPRLQRCRAPRGWDIPGTRCPLSLGTGPGVPRGAGGAPHGRDPAALPPAQGTGDTPE